MRAWIVLRALLGHWRRHPVELVTLLAGLAIATALWSGVQALNAEARASYARAAGVLGGDVLAQVVATGGGAIALTDYVALRRAGWRVSPVLEGELDTDAGAVRILGVDPVTLPAEAGSLAVGDGPERLASFLLPPHLALAAPQTIAELGPVDALPPFEAREDLPPGTVIVDISVAARLLARPDTVSRLLLAEATEARVLPPDLAPRLRIESPRTDGDLARLTDSFHLNLTAFGFLSFVVGLFIVYSAIGLAFEQRRPMLRTLRACGVSARLLTGVMVSELVALALVAGLVGVVAGYLIASVLLPNVSATLRGLYGAQVSGSLSLAPSWWAAGMAISVLGALVAATGSLWRAWRLPLLAPAQPQAWLGAQRRGLARQVAAAGLLGAGALGALKFGTGLVAGFAVMGGLLLAAALLLPAVLAGALRLGAGLARGAMVQWFWADARQQLSGLSLALMALLLALAVNVGVGTMVDSFRQTFTGWLDQRLASEVYLSATDAEEARALGAWLDARPEVRARLPIWRAEARLDGWPLEIYGFADDATYRDTWPLLAALPDGWDRVARGEAALISEQMARRLGLAPGDTLALPTPEGPWEVTVAAVYSDYGNPAAQVMIAVDELTARWPDVERLRSALRVDPEEVARLIGDLARAFPQVEAVDQQALKALSTRIFEQTFTVTVALNALTLAVAGIALLTSLLTLANLRLVQVAPLWAMGITRRQLALIELGRAVGLAALTALAALPLGLAVAWVLTAVVNVQAFGWKLPVHLFPTQWLTLLALALATAGLAAIWPAWRLRRASPLSLLQGFSNER